MKMKLIVQKASLRKYVNSNYDFLFIYLVFSVLELHNLNLTILAFLFDLFTW